MENIDEMINQFLSKLKPVTPKMVETGIITEEKPPVPPGVPSEAPPEEGKGCVTKDFKEMVGLLPPEYIGKDGKDVKDLVIMFLDSIAECKEA